MLKHTALNDAKQGIRIFGVIEFVDGTLAQRKDMRIDLPASSVVAGLPSIS
jgi:hypothetical protein